MAPPRKHDTDHILDAARTVILRDGPRATSVAAIARESERARRHAVPSFRQSRRVLAAAWLRALENSSAARWRRHGTPRPVGGRRGDGKLADQLRPGPARGARLLLTLRRNDLLDADPDDLFRERLGAINAPLEATLAALTRRCAGGPTRERWTRVTRAVVDLPHATIRRYVRDSGTAVLVEDDVAVATRKLLES